MSARALVSPWRGLSDRGFRHCNTSTRVGDLSQVLIAPVTSPASEWIEADPAVTAWNWFLPTAKAMLQLTFLPPGWDSRTARRIERLTIERAIGLLAGILDRRTAQPAIVPTICGGVQAEWHMGGLNIEIEFAPSGDAAVSVEDLLDGTEWQGDLRTEIERLRPYLLRLEAA